VAVAVLAVGGWGSSAIAQVPGGGPAAEFITTRVAGIKLKRIPEGEFLMGSSRDEDKDAADDEMVNGRKHRVRITRPFYLGVTEVTQAQYLAVTGENPSRFEGPVDLPVEGVSWNDAVAFCDKLSELEGLKPYYRLGPGERPSGDGYRLPTEAEWEYACRARSPVPVRYSFGDDPAGLGEHAWFGGNSGGRTHPVGQKRPNGFGLYDMHGNVWEWCWDGYDAEYYARSPVDDPQGPSGAYGRVFRGGGWRFDPRYARSAYRAQSVPGYRGREPGLRLARGQ
jgi:formylglycine-generating enzyme required for sulfatase activity